jgi:hypothetical protein
MKHAARAMKRAGGGCIVVTSIPLPDNWDLARQAG